MLQFNQDWRYHSPCGIERDVEDAFHEMIVRSARGQQEILEHFKKYFAYASGNMPSRSSSESWADTDLLRLMSECSDNAPIFIEAFYDACLDLKKAHQDFVAPDVAHINHALAQHSSVYRIELPDLVYIGDNQTHHEIPSIPSSFDDLARSTIKSSFEEAQRLLAENRYRPAVQELLWLLETIITAFKGQESNGSTIQGKYFNLIVKDIKEKNKGKTLEQVVQWMTALHGYLSAPSGGGIRHGIDLKVGLPISANDACLFCNLIISYIKFFLNKFDSLDTENDLF